MACGVRRDAAEGGCRGAIAMGAQQAKERGTASGASMRSARTKPRVPKDPRILGSNIFTEHSGK